MFHEILDDESINSGWNLRNRGKYTISKSFFKDIIKTYHSNVEYTFDDGGISNLYAANQLKKNNIKGYFFICTNFIGKPGFLSKEDINEISKYHFLFSHGHNHIMSNVNYIQLYNDWKQSLEIMSNYNNKIDTICLPGGFFTKSHKKLFLTLKVKNIFHSGPYNFIMRFLYSSELNFIPRIVVTKKFKSIKKLNYIGSKSLLKQVYDYLK